MRAGAAEEAVGESGGAVAGVEDEQRRRLRAVPGGAQAAQHVLHLRDRLGRPGRGRGARHVHEGGPCGAQVPDRRGELVLPAGRGLAGALAVAGAVVHVLPARGAPRVRPGIGGRVDGEPQPGPPGARVPHLSGIPGRQPGQRLLQQAPVDHVVLRDPPAVPRGRPRPAAAPPPAGRTASRPDPPGGQRVVQGAVAPGELRLQAQLHQRRHRVIGAQHRVGQLEQRVRPRRPGTHTATAGTRAAAPGPGSARPRPRRPPGPGPGRPRARTAGLTRFPEGFAARNRAVAG